MAFFQTSDGAKLYYRDSRGSLEPLILLHGWSQSGSVFERQWNALKASCRVISLDFRGHGNSPDPGSGYRISRLAKDLEEFLEHLGFKQVHLLGWSMGASVIWSYLDLFGPRRCSSFVFVDQPPWPLPSFSIYEGEAHTLDGALLERVYSGLNGDSGDQFARDFLRMMYSKELPDEEVEKLEVQTLLAPRKASARLLVDNICADYRDVIAEVRLPTLVIGAEGSLIKSGTQQWIAEQIPGAHLEIFSTNEGGSHFMFYENPEKFNQLVLDHLRNTERSRREKASPQMGAVHAP